MKTPPAFYCVSQLASEFARERAAMIEAQLVRSIEELLGRVPSDKEVSSHGMRFLSTSQPTLEEFYWKDNFLFGVETNFPHAYCYFDFPMIKRTS